MITFILNPPGGKHIMGLTVDELYGVLPAEVQIPDRVPSLYQFQNGCWV